LDVSNYEKAKNCKKIVDAQKKLLQGGVSWKRNWTKQKFLQLH
jgi:hypothetical protein